MLFLSRLPALLALTGLCTCVVPASCPPPPQRSIQRVDFVSTAVYEGGVLDDQIEVGGALDGQLLHLTWTEVDGTVRTETWHVEQQL